MFVSIDHAAPHPNLEFAPEIDTGCSRDPVFPNRLWVPQFVRKASQQPIRIHTEYLPHAEDTEGKSG